METTSQISALVQEQLRLIVDTHVKSKIMKFLVEPYPTERGWDYGRPDETMVCWMVLEHKQSNTGIAYCSTGFGPKNPWGLLFLSGPYMNMGADYGWYASLEHAFMESFASEDQGDE